MKTKALILIAACSLALNTNTNSQTLPGEIAGTVTDEQGNPVPGAIISYTINATLQGTSTDENGRYRLKPLDAGKYEVTFSFTGLSKIIYRDVQVNTGQITSLSAKLVNDNTLPVYTHTYHTGLFEKDITTVGKRFDKEEVKLSIGRDVKDIVSTTPTVNHRDDGKDINVRGSRSDATQYYVDGVKVIGGFSVPKSSIKEINVITGGVPAMFGDATGGIVMITTKSYWDN
jgi:hypothetical protein